MSRKAKRLCFHTLFDTYYSVEKIGSGGCGDVYKVKDENDDIFSVKCLAPDRINKNKAKRFKNELYFCSKNEHKNIIKVLDYGYIDLKGKKCPFLIIPYYPETLRSLMKKGISTDKVLGYFSQILDGVEAAHLQGIWHRDLKPENILCDPSSGTLVIADFGIAHFTEDWLYTLVETRPQERLANFQYAAPEQREREKNVDQRADIYALGMILNEMFTGQVPHGTGYKTIGSVSSGYGYLDDLVANMLKQSPEERPAQIEDIKKQLIARKNEFVTQQKISSLKKTVIPVTEIDDPLIADPPKLVEFDWNRGILTLILNQAVNSKWIWALQNMGNHTSLLNKGPESFTFSGNKATINADEDEIQDAINYFKNWLPRANQVYEQIIRREKQEAELKIRFELQQRIKEQEARKRVLEKVKI
jgi:serine/threonine protein kinase